MIDPNLVRVESLMVVGYGLALAGWSLSDPPGADAAVDARLVVSVLEAGGAARRTTVRSGGLIGRGAECELRLDDGAVAKWQVRLAYDGHVATLEVLDAGAPTSLNDRPVRGGAVLSPGDRIGVGGVTIQFDGVSFDRPRP